MQLFIVLSAVLACAYANHDGYDHVVNHIYHPHHNQHNEEMVHTNYHHQDHQEDHHESEHYVDYVGHPKYHYDYAVHDPHTHDEKNQWEVRDGKHVKGEYSVVQPDGKTRVVSYESNGHGTNCVVKYVHGHHY